MPGPLTAGELFQVGASLFQFLVAATLLLPGRGNPLRLIFGTIIALSGIESVMVLSGASDLALHSVDRPLLWAIVVGLAMVPRPIRDWPIRWILLVGAVAASGQVVLEWIAPVFQVTRAIGGYAPFTIGALLMALHAVPRLIELRPGPLRTQSLFALAGLGLSSASTLGGWALLRGLQPQDVPLWATSTIMILPGVFFLGAAISRLAWSAIARRDGAIGAAAGLLIVAGLLGTRALILREGAAGEFATQAVRPLLLAAAILHVDLFRVPAGVRRVLVPASAVAFAGLTFLIAAMTLEADGVNATRLSASTALASLGVVVGVSVLARGPLTRALRPPDEGEDTMRRLEAYRLELERRPAPRARRADDELAQLRARLQITGPQHETLEALLRENLVVPTRSLAPAHVGDRIAGRYTVVRELGSGGFGRALLAEDELDGGRVVLKEVLLPWSVRGDAQVKALAKEHDVSQRIATRHVAASRGLVQDGSRHYLVRDYIEGTTLAEAVRDLGPLPVDRVRALGRDLAEGLAAIHAAGIVHGDLKPENVILAGTNRAVLIDFGAARQLDGGDVTQLSVTQQQPRAGTLLWQAPEQVRGQPVSPASDLFALGAVLHFALTGQNHLGTDDVSAFELQERILRTDPPELARPVPAELSDLVRDLLQRDPDGRPSEAAEVVAHLEPQR